MDNDRYFGLVSGGIDVMRKFLLLIGKCILFSCFAIVALFVFNLFFWAETEGGKLASKTVIIFFSFIGFFVFCIRDMVQKENLAAARGPWERTEPKRDYQATGYAMTCTAKKKNRGPAPRITKTYKLKVAVLATLGYAYIYGLFFVLAALLYYLVSLSFKAPDPRIFIAVSLPFFFVAARMLIAIVNVVRFREPLPDGLEITPYDAPELFEAVKHLREHLKGPEIGKIFLTSDFNAFIVQSPRIGLFGWYRNSLILGLPLLQALTAKQVISVLAHEYGHLSGRHGRLGSRVYRIRKSWMRISGTLESKKHWSTAILAKFCRWYAPYFHSYTQPFARAHEYEADRCSVRVAGMNDTAAALVRYEVLSAYLNECFRPAISALADTVPDPVESYYGLMQDKFHQGIDERKAKEWIDRSLSRETDAADTHPCLRDRLEAIREIAVFHNSLDQSAAEAFFLDLNTLRKWLDEEWKSQAEAKWRERHAHVQKMQSKIDGLIAKAKAHPLNVEDSWELAYLIEELSGSDKAFPFYERILKYKPKYVPALYAVGRIALAKGDESGVSYIEEVIALDSNYSINALETLYNFYLESGDRENTGKYFQRLFEQRETRERAQQGRKD